MTPRTATPPYLFIGTLPHPHYRLRKALRVKIDRCEDGSVIAWSGLLNSTWGHGPHMTAAVESFQMHVISVYEMLRRERPCLGPTMLKLLARMDALILIRP